MWLRGNPLAWGGGPETATIGFGFFMIASLRGKLFQKLPETVIVEVGGVGYEVFFPQAVQHRLPKTGEELFFLIQTVVREDAFSLYGFLESEEKATFLLLTTVSGIGPKVAHNILASITPAELGRAVANDDIHRLIKLPGIGKKTAERICLELKDKVQFLPSPAAGAESPAGRRPVKDQRGSDAVSALVNLGYPQARAEEAVERVRGQLPPATYDSLRLEELLRQALRALV